MILKYFLCLMVTIAAVSTAGDEESAQYIAKKARALTREISQTVSASYIIDREVTHLAAFIARHQTLSDIDALTLRRTVGLQAKIIKVFAEQHGLGEYAEQKLAVIKRL